jgi:hypothetical protein
VGESAAETLKEIHETREQLGEKVEELEERVPAAATARWGLRLAMSGLGGTLAWFVLRRLRHPQSVQAKPEVVVPPLHFSVQLVPERWARALDTPRGQALVGAAAVGWFFLKWMALRQRSR